MNHLGTRTLNTPRLTLRRLELGDAQAMFDNWASDPVATRYLSWPPYTELDDVAAFIQQRIDEYCEESCYQWAIVLDEIKQPIGSIGIHAIRDDIARGEVGYVIGRKWWGQGIVPEALLAVLGFLFDEVGFECVYAGHDTRNPNSGKVMAKCGMAYEGTLRHAQKCNLGVSDVCVRSILKSEWEMRQLVSVQR